MTRGRIVRSLLAGFLGITLVIGLFFLTGVSFASIGTLMTRINALSFAGIVVCSFLYVVLGAVKWHLITGVAAPRAFFYTYYTAQAMLIGQFLPPPVAIAASRAAVMKLKQNTTVKKGFLNALYDMGFDFLIALLLIPASLAQWLYKFDFGFWFAIGASTILVTGLLLAQMPRFFPAAWLAVLGLAEERKHGMLSPRLIGLMMFLSAARFAVVTIRLVLGAIALGIAVPLEIVAYATPPATMPALLVLTPANLGIAEWSWAYLFTLWGIPAAVGALYSVSFRILVFFAQLIVSGACWILYVYGDRHIKKAA